jgi:hypothetical protein
MSMYYSVGYNFCKKTYLNSKKIGSFLMSLKVHVNFLYDVEMVWETSFKIYYNKRCPCTLSDLIGL